MFDDSGSVLSFLALVLLYIPVGILWAYFTSFAFNNPETCLVALPNIVVLVSAWLPLPSSRPVDIGVTSAMIALAGGSHTRGSFLLSSYSSDVVNSLLLTRLWSTYKRSQQS